MMFSLIILENPNLLSSIKSGSKTVTALTAGGDRAPGQTPGRVTKHSRVSPNGLLGRARNQAKVLQHGTDAGLRPTPGYVHFLQVLGIAARQDHVAEAVAVGASPADRESVV